jgi:dihydrofolate reductase
MDDRKRKDEILGQAVMGTVVSLDGFIADDHDDVGPLFDWFSNGEVTWAFEGTDDEFRTTQASADFMRSHYRDVAAVVIGRRLFDLTDGWNGKPAAGEHVFVVTHQPPTDWKHADTAPFTFVDGVDKAIAAAKEFAGERLVDVAAGQIGSPGAQARADRPGGRQPGSGGHRLRPPVLRHQRPGRAAAAGESDHYRARRPVTHLVYDVSH